MNMKNHRTECCEFEMTVTDVFAFEDGRTVFTGEVRKGPNYIPACKCVLLFNGTLVARIRIEGEMLPMNSVPQNLRSVSTADKVDVALVRASQGTCELKADALNN